MAGRVGVGTCVGVWGRVAATDVAAFEADPEEQPRVSCRQAILAAVDGNRKLGELDIGAVSAQVHATRECQPTDVTHIVRTRNLYTRC